MPATASAVSPPDPYRVEQEALCHYNGDIPGQCRSPGNASCKFGQRRKLLQMKFPVLVSWQEPHHMQPMYPSTSSTFTVGHLAPF